MRPASFHLQYSQQEIGVAVRRLGAEISTWAEETWAKSHTDVLTVPVLRGGIFFFADLVREIKTSVEIAPIRTWAYEIGQNQVQRKDVSVSLDGVAARGRTVLLVDDICDSGNTLARLSASLREAGALEVRSAVLIRRSTSVGRFEPDWIGFEYEGHEWFVGYGMEDTERWRNLPDIYVIRSGE